VGSSAERVPAGTSSGTGGAVHDNADCPGVRSVDESNGAAAVIMQYTAGFMTSGIVMMCRKVPESSVTPVWYSSV